MLARCYELHDAENLTGATPELADALVTSKFPVDCVLFIMRIHLASKMVNCTSKPSSRENCSIIQIRTPQGFVG